MAGGRPARRPGLRVVRGGRRVLAPRRTAPRDDGRGALAGPSGAARPVQRILLRVRQPGRRLAHPGHVPEVRRARVVVGLRPRARAQPARGQGPRRRGARDLRPRRGLGRVPRGGPGRGAREHPAHGCLHRPHDGPAAARLVHPLRVQSEHAGAAGRGGRLPLRQPGPQRRPSLLRAREGPAVARRALHLRGQRCAVLARGPRQRRRLRGVHALRLRLPLRRGAARAAHDVDRPALPHRRHAGPVARLRRLPRVRQAISRRVVRQARGHRPLVARAPAATRA